jgi:hypothetical protein
VFNEGYLSSSHNGLVREDLVADALRLARGLAGLLPDEPRQRTTIVTANYGQASAINYFGPASNLPRASTGHMTFFLWGPANPSAEVLLTVGLDRAWLVATCGSLTPATESDHPLGLPHERRLPIHVCRELRAPLTVLWPELKRFDHGIRPAPPH